MEMGDGDKMAATQAEQNSTLTSKIREYQNRSLFKGWGKVTKKAQRLGLVTAVSLSCFVF